MFRIICLAIGYLFGLIQTSLIVGKLIYKVDVREHGSGNPGSTNTLRTLGLKAGIGVFACDILKAAIAFLVSSAIFGGGSIFFPPEAGLGVLPGLYAGLGTILGHNFPFYLKFKGGKGIATTIGTFLVLDYRVAWISYILGIISVAVTKYVSVGSLVISVSFPVMMIIFGYGAEEIIIGFVITIIAFLRHKKNIKALIDGSERKISVKK